MTGSVALDVVIGLVFIYSIYSLLASIVQEMIANFLGLRARNLRHGISRMLKDEPKKKSSNIVTRAVWDTKERLKRNLIPEKETHNLVKAFYEQPVIKYLASGRFFSKPSYINPSDFSKALMEILKAKGDPNSSAIDRVREGLSNADQDMGEETRTYLLSLLEDAQNDLVRFKFNLEEWFDHTMNRASGWYKRTIQAILVLIGFGVAVCFNVNTVEIVSILAKDEAARDGMVQLASNYMNENEEILALYRKGQKTSDTPETEKDSINEEVVEAPVDELTLNRMDFDSKLDSLLKVRTDLEKDREEVNNIMGFRPIEDLPAEPLTTYKGERTSRHRIIESCGEAYIVTFPSAFLANRTKDYYRIEKRTVGTKTDTYAAFQDIPYIWANFWGYLITALAISLGAPFWFDILSKLIKIRSSVQAKSTTASIAENRQPGAVPVNERVG